MCVSVPYLIYFIIRRMGNLECYVVVSEQVGQSDQVFVMLYVLWWLTSVWKLLMFVFYNVVCIYAEIWLVEEMIQ